MYGINNLNNTLKVFMYLESFCPRQERLNKTKLKFLLSRSERIPYKINERTKAYIYDENDLWNYIISQDKYQKVINMLKVKSYVELALKCDEYYKGYVYIY